MNHRFFALALCAYIAGGALAQPAAPVAPEEVSFRFNPPDGTRVTTDYKLQRTRSVAGQPPVRDEADARTEGVFKRTAGGFELSQRTLALAMTRNGAAVDDPALKLLAQQRPTMVISDAGELTDVRGFGEITGFMKALPPALATALAPVFNEKALITREQTEWNARYAEFAGTTLKIGQLVDAQAPQPLPGGASLTYTIRTTVPRWEACPAGRCVRVEQVYESDAQALAGLAVDLVNRIASAASEPAPAAAADKPTPARLSGALSRLIDPETMLIYAERVERTLTMPLKLAGQGDTTVTQTEVRTYEHRYDRP